ncbi:hypothetical protein BRC65_00545, partial [Halobacteriales archaeon QH_2_65_14]
RGEQLLSVYAPGVLDNDVDPELADLSASVSTPPANGNVTLSADGSFEYVPDIGFDGVDTFVYAASDGVDTDTATVTIDVTDPRLVADDLEVAPTSVSAGEIVTVSANFTNPTNETVAKKATVMADGQRLNSESVTLESGETKRVSVDVTLYRSGDRAVSFPDFDGNETVTVERTVSDREWESWHLNPEHRNFDPTISGPRQPVSELWNTALPDGYNVPMRPVVVNDTIFASSYESTFAMDARTGDLLWNNASVLGTYLGGIAHDDGRLFVSTSLGEFHALDAETGDGLWARQDIGTYDTAPAVNDGTVFIPGDNSDMWALDAATGNTVWSVTYSDARYPADYAAPTAVDDQSTGDQGSGNRISATLKRRRPSQMERSTSPTVVTAHRTSTRSTWRRAKRSGMRLPGMATPVSRSPRTRCTRRAVATPCSPTTPTPARSSGTGRISAVPTTSANQ